MNIKNEKLMHQRIQCKLEEFLAVSLFASKDETRYILNSVHVDVSPTHVFFVSTDGRRLAVIDAATESQSDESWDVTIPVEAIRRFAKVTAKRGDFYIEFDGVDVSLIVSDVSGTATVKTKAAEGIYPGWRQVAPIGENIAVATLGVNPEFLVDFQKAAKALRPDSGLIFGLYGKDSAVQIQVEGVPNFYGVLMPLREVQLKLNAPEWLGLEFKAAVNS